MGNIVCVEQVRKVEILKKDNFLQLCSAPHGYQIIDVRGSAECTNMLEKAKNIPYLDIENRIAKEEDLPKAGSVLLVYGSGGDDKNTMDAANALAARDCTVYVFLGGYEGLSA
eukprot:PhF_6_TR44021/c0_g1_i1/m.67221